MIRGRSIFIFCYVTNLLIQSVFVLATLFNGQTLSQTYLVLMLTTVGATTLIFALLQGQKKEKNDEKC